MKYIEIINEYIDLEKTVKNYEEQLFERFKNDSSAFNLNPESFIEKLISIDPTGSKGNYVFWLLKMYIDKKFDFKDLNKIKNYLSIFHKLKHLLKVEERDINKIKSIDELERIYEKLKNLKTKKEEKKNIKKEIIEKETEIIYDGAEGKIISPKTYRSSCFWGINTKWCTASKLEIGKKHYDFYVSRGKLYIFILPNGKKYQLFFDDISADFRNELNERVILNSEEEIEKYLDIIKLFEIFLNFLPKEKAENLLINFLKYSSNLYFFKNFIEKFVSEEKILENLVKINPENIVFFENFGKDFIEKVVKAKPIVVKYLKNVYDYDIYKHALEYFYTIPKEIVLKIPLDQIEKICLHKPYIIYVLPEEIRNKLSLKFYEELLKLKPKIIDIIPEKYNDFREKYLTSNTEKFKFIYYGTHFNNNDKFYKYLIKKYPEKFKEWL